MTSTEIVRLRRQMQLRIREVVAERRLARQYARSSATDSGQIAPENASTGRA